MKYKIGDKVRVIENLADIPKGSLGIVDDMYKYVNRVATIIKVRECSYQLDIDNGMWSWGDYMLEAVEDDYITTKEFIKLVEDMGYNGEIRNGNMVVTYGGSIVGYINEKYVNRLGTDFYEEVRNSLMKVMVLYANTPLELREEKEQLYTLELPNTTIKARYFRFGLPHAKYSYKFGVLPKSTTNSDIDYQTHFTQKEIDELPNQELIKALVKREVKENEQ